MPNDFHFVSFATLFSLVFFNPNKELLYIMYAGRIQEALSDSKESLR